PLSPAVALAPSFAPAPPGWHSPSLPPRPPPVGASLASPPPCPDHPRHPRPRHRTLRPRPQWPPLRQGQPRPPFARRVAALRSALLDTVTPFEHGRSNENVIVGFAGCTDYFQKQGSIPSAWIYQATLALFGPAGFSLSWRGDLGCPKRRS